MLLPYFEEEGLKSLYDSSKKWWNQRADVVGTVVPVFACPSVGGDNPNLDKSLEAIWIVGGVKNDYRALGVTNYAFCKGVTDAYCLAPGNLPPGPNVSGGVPASERGLFDFNWGVSTKRVTDGTSNTIAMGEVAHGPSWLVSNAEPTVQVWNGTVYDNKRTSLPGPGSYGEPRLCWQAWCAAQPSYSSLNAIIYLHVGNIMACTLEPINKWPPSQAQYQDSQPQSCNKSQFSAPGTTGATTSGGVHIAPNFRSDHPGGCLFLFADGSVHFLDEGIDMLTYQWLSTMQGGETASPPTE
jgi:prepilin-type processing-associated H-X9-DG protein